MGIEPSSVAKVRNASSLGMFEWHWTTLQCCS